MLVMFADSLANLPKSKHNFRPIPCQQLEKRLSFWKKHSPKEFDNLLAAG